MNIGMLSDEEKSVMLAKMCGWLSTNNSFISYFPPNGSGLSVNHKKGYCEIDIFLSSEFSRMTLYDTKNMALAWRVLNGLHNPKFDTDVFNDFLKWWGMTGDATPIWWYEPKDAQRAWLDKILELAIEAGLV